MVHIYLTLGLLTGELAVSSKESSKEMILVLVFLGSFKLLWDFFHKAQESASETKEELSRQEEKLCSL